MCMLWKVVTVESVEKATYVFNRLPAVVKDYDKLKELNAERMAEAMYKTIHSWARICSDPFVTDE